jgi:hypothetical protein
MRRTGTALGAAAAALALGAASASLAPAAQAAPPLAAQAAPPLAAQAAQPPLTVRIDPTGTVSPAGLSAVAGTFSCPVGNVFFGHATVYQPAAVPNAAYSQGLVGSSANPVPCTGAPEAWAVTTVPRRGGFVPGRATVYAFMTTVGPAGVGSVLVRRNVQLAPAAVARVQPA